MDDNDFREVGTFADEFGIVFLLEVDAHETVCLVGVELGIVVYDLGDCNGLKTGQFGKTRIVFPVFFL